ncbi:DUF2326 domain-containing protein [Nocardia brasiliensis]|uniref:DUF2326 domain-containing protein n=1 Tax=Nocardia brasiliensis TaxID=37326 RepID=UPI00245594A2|nr:DUF2326 domain-containing protein [Nocardia brasiliensis]
MKLSRLYSNQSDVFGGIEFGDGVNVILAEIRVPANRDLDTHNLGKTTVGELLDFCLLKGKSNRFFLFKHEVIFHHYTFYLELELGDGTFLNIARPVHPGTKVDIKRSAGRVADASELSIGEWDHVGVPLERAKLMLDGILGFDVLRPWGFRKLVGYLIRSQRDYLDVFRLDKFSGKHQDWKPFVAHLLGMTAETVIDLYKKREEVENAKSRLATLAREWGADDSDPSVLDGLISVKRREVEEKSKSLDSFNFGAEDHRATAEVVEYIESNIAALNESRYRLAQLIVRLNESMENENIVFRTEESEKLFNEAGIIFGDQLKRDYRQLVAFNRAITQERRDALGEQLVEARAQTAAIDEELRTLNVERARSLEYLRESESLTKYKDLSRDLTVLRSELSRLESQRAAAARLIDIRREVRIAEEGYGRIQNQVEAELIDISQDDSSHFGILRRYFTEIIYDVLGQNAILAIKVNGRGGLDFIAEFVGDSGAATSGDRGTTYRKLLCIAFDLALLRSYIDVPFARFVYHDGAIEQLEPRKRRKLIAVFRQYAEYGIQPIFSALDSDLPEPADSSSSAISSEEIILILHDEGEDGRLFRRSSW